MNLPKLLKTLDIIKSRKEYELRVNGESRKYKDLREQWLNCLNQIGKATECQ